MKITFWGVRGSIPVSGPRFAATGGNTACVQVEHAGEMLVLDGGTGLRALGEHLGRRPLKATLLFTHVHWDHIQGVPFFGPAFHPDSALTFAAAGARPGALREALAVQMRPPQFPVPLEALVGARSFLDVPREGTFEVGPFEITACAQDHPDGVVAYRVEAGGRSLVFATDTEHRGAVDPRLIRLSEGADLLVHDAQYTPAQYRGEVGPARVGWGHSSWDAAVRVAVRASAARLALFHHDPGHGDEAVAAIERAAARILPGTFAAREGLSVAL